ncbi:MAG: tetratricopeptide repeat protein, partial [Promethearchaeota archaeon]
MSSKDLKRAEILIKEGKFNEAQIALNEIEQKGDLSSSDLLSFYLFKGSILNIVGSYSNARKYGELAYRKSQELMRKLQSIDALLIMAYALTHMGDIEKGMDVIVQCEELLKTLKVEDQREITKRKGALAAYKGLAYFFMSKPELSLNNVLLSLKLREEVGDKNEIAQSLMMLGTGYLYLEGNFEESLKYSERCQGMADEVTDRTIMAYNLINLGSISLMKGDLKQSLDEYHQALEILEEFNNMQYIGACLNNIGEIYRKQGKIHEALKYYDEALTLTEKIGNVWMISTQLNNLLLLALEIGDIKLAKDYLGRMEKLSNQSESKRVKGNYQLCKALILKTSPRAHNRSESEEILRNIVNEEMVDFELTTDALINLCDLLLIELKITNDPELLEEIQNFITQLLNISESQNSYFLLAETYLLQSQISLLTLEIKKAQRYLIQAQQIAERFNLNHLKEKIAYQNEDLQRNLNLWDKLKEVGAPLADRLELARLEEQIGGMLQSRSVLTSQVKEEEVTIQKEKKICLVCRGVVLRFSYICECGAIYCEDCARAVSNLENVCWACETAIDYNKPVKQFKEEQEGAKFKDKG